MFGGPFLEAACLMLWGKAPSILKCPITLGNPIPQLTILTHLQVSHCGYCVIVTFYTVFKVGAKETQSRMACKAVRPVGMLPEGGGKAWSRWHLLHAGRWEAEVRPGLPGQVGSWHQFLSPLTGGRTQPAQASHLAQCPGSASTCTHGLLNLQGSPLDMTTQQAGVRAGTGTHLPHSSRDFFLLHPSLSPRFLCFPKSNTGYLCI